MWIKRKLTKLFVTAIVAIAAVLLTGCGASVTVYDYTENGVRYNTYEIAIDLDTVEQMEKTSSLDRNGNKYTVQNYLYSLFTEFGYELTDATSSDGVYKVSYRKAVSGEPDLFKIGTPVEFTYTSTSDPFIKTYVSTSPNPFNGVREYYDNIGAEKSTTILERIKNGVTARDEYGDTVIISHSITSAFPYLRSSNADGLLLNYAQTRSDRMKSSGTEERVGSRSVRYTFSRYFDYIDNTIAYEYKRAVPYGWYLVAVAAGALVFAIIILATKLRAKQDISIDN